MTEPELVDELVALGRTLVIEPPADDVVVAVLTRIEARPTRRRTRSSGPTVRRRRLVAIVVAAVIIGLGLTPPVRAAVAEWLRIGGVLIGTAPAPAPTDPSLTPEPPPTVGAEITVERAQALVAFPVGVPDTLGRPTRVAVSEDRRIVAMDWVTGTERIHLDQFDGQLDWVFVKRTRDPYTITEVQGRDAVWFATAHEVSYLDRDGRERTEQARVAGPTLVWEREVSGTRVTMRLEGETALPGAVEIADSVR